MMKNEKCFISEKAIIGKNVRIGHGSIIYDNVEIGDNSFIGPYCIIGEPTMGFYKQGKDHVFSITKIGENAVIRAHTIIYENVIIGDFFQTGHHAVIREDTIIGRNTSFGTHSETPGRSKIGNFVRIHSNVMLSENNEIEDYVWIFPFVVLANVKYPPIGKFEKTTIKEYAMIFTHATVLPGITIGKNAIIGANSLVVKDVLDERLVIGNPGRDVKSVRNIRDENGNFLYPWKDYLKQNRGYPWQYKL